ncbi:uncharacterized protein LOC108112750 [Drosophila eugracilis]|uniref:uncharacterized protein LOC108112750 n=1 Tax=Drosophila eugracilis TaxID=29029 RepID=UPI0007E793D2|nr:uncharacterized protein LOC108112750 [Drosophila eugracilis]
MILQKLIKFVLFAGSFYLGKELGVFEDPIEPNTPRLEVEPFEAESNQSGQPEEKKSPDNKHVFFDEEDKRKLKRKKEEMEKKFCPKGSICEPPPKPLGESIGDALYDTWLALKKIPSYWRETADSMADTICRFFKGDK